MSTKAETQRTAIVVKANELIQKTTFSLSAREQKLLLFLISKISMYDTEFKTIEIQLNEFCKICGIQRGGNSYEMVRRQIKELADKSVWILQDDGTQVLLRWLSRARIEKDGTINVKISEDMEPYLLQLKSHYTRYELIYTLRFKSKYSIRLYELVQSLQYDENKPYEYDIEIEELKKRLDALNYTEYKEFKKRVLQPALKEINEYSDKNVEILKINRGNKVVGLRLRITSKSMAEIVYLRDKVDTELGTDEVKNQLSIFELAEQQYGPRKN